MANELITYETYTPSPVQLEAHLDPTQYKLFGGAMNCGKSFWLCSEVIRLMLMFPGNVGYLARFRYRDLKRSTLPILLQMIPEKIIKSYNKSDGHIQLINGSSVYCGDLEDPNKLKSMNLGFFAIDEATDVPNENAFNMLTTRLRLILPGIKRFGLLATNPEPGWVKDKFITNIKQGFKFFPALPQDNPAYDPEYINDVTRNLPAAMRLRYLEGSWDAFDDLVFRPEWVYPNEKLGEIENEFCITFLDPAISEKESADETAIVTVAIEKETGIINDVDVVHGRWSYDTIKKNAKAVWAMNKPDQFVVESIQAQDWLCQDLLKEGIPVTRFKPDCDKIRKAYTIQYLFEIGRIRINNKDLQRQLLEFPKGTHDDIADAFISALVCFKRASQDELQKKVSIFKQKQKSWRDEVNKQNDYSTMIKQIMQP